MSAAPGPIGEEAARLIESLSDWAHRVADLPLATGSDECRLCPICQSLTLARQAKPETFAHLADAAAALLAAARSMTGTPAAEDRRQDSDGARHRVQRIDLDDDAGAGR